MRGKLKKVIIFSCLLFIGCNSSAMAGDVEEIRSWLNLSKEKVSDKILSEELNLKYQGGSKTYYDIFTAQKEVIELGKEILDPNFPPPTLLDKLNEINYKVCELSGGIGGGVIAVAAGEPLLGGVVTGLFKIAVQNSKEFDAISEQNQKTKWSMIKNYIGFRKSGMTEEKALNVVYPDEISIKKTILKPKEAEYWYQVYKFAQNEEQIKAGDSSALLNVLPLQIQMSAAANSTISAVAQQSTQQAFQLSQNLSSGLSQISSDLAKKLSDENPTFDSSLLSDRTAQQLLTPINVSFTQIFDGLFTQSADFFGSQGGNHSGTFTDGTRIGAGSVPGNFTSGSFSGRTITETGYTPTTFNNQPFSGSSVGTATARGFQEGTLSGSMTVTVPAGTQTAAVSGNITINTDGSLSMPSYSGPVTDNGTGATVGAMSGSWNQGPTK